jgi:hypothetical protein
MKKQKFLQKTKCPAVKQIPSSEKNYCEFGDVCLLDLNETCSLYNEFIKEDNGCGENKHIGICSIVLIKEVKTDALV